MADTIKGLPELLAAFSRLPAQVQGASLRGITRCTLIAHRESIRNAPRSPSMKQQTAQRKTTRDTSKQKKPTATSRAKPGGLERSISQEVDASKCEGMVFVASNSEARKYAKRIHDGKGSEWENRGAGTIAKGPQADDKFIERAINDNADAFKKILTSELEKALKL